MKIRIHTALRKLKRALYLLLTWPFNDRDDYDRFVGAQVPIPAWILVALASAVVYAAIR